MMKSIKGASLVEYGLLVGLIAVVAITAVTNLGSTVNEVFSSVATKLSDSVGAAVQ
jgi:pilus assembly protein Flp/PilA